MVSWEIKLITSSSHIKLGGDIIGAGKEKNLEKKVVCSLSSKVSRLFYSTVQCRRHFTAQKRLSVLTDNFITRKNDETRKLHSISHFKANLTLCTAIHRVNAFNEKFQQDSQICLKAKLVPDGIEDNTDFS